MPVEKKKKGLLPERDLLNFISKLDSINFNEALQKKPLQCLTELINETEIFLLELYRNRYNHQKKDVNVRLKQLTSDVNATYTSEKINIIRKALQEIESLDYEFINVYSDVDALMRRKQ